jgi:Fe-S cluster biogenesis protein NfuA
MPHVVQVAPTPNPNARKLIVAQRLVGAGTFEYASVAEAAGHSPLAQRLFAVDGVENVLVASDFVTVRKAPAADWERLEPALTEALRGFLGSYQLAVFDEDAGAGEAGVAPRNDVEARIVALLDEEIRPAVATDGGEVTFMGFSEGIVLLRLSGACGSCPSSVTTLKMGIERLLVEEIPEVKGVESVA